MIILLKLNVFVEVMKKDACFSVPVHPEHYKYLIFSFIDLYQCTCKSKGYRQTMEIIIKLTKLTFLHQ